jgi:hypothetical protein
VGGERQSLIDVQLARNTFRLDVLKLRKQLAGIGVGRDPDKRPTAAAVVTTPEGSTVEPSGEAGAATPPAAAPSKTEPAPTASV